jgi:hypothetical protein
VLFLVAMPASASPIYQCSFNAGAFTTTGCFGNGSSPGTSFITTNDFLDWGAPATAGLGVSGTQYGPPNTWTGSNWTATTTVNPIGVGVGVAGQQFTRADNVGFIQYGLYAGDLGNSIVTGAVTGDFNTQNAPPGPVDPSGQYNSVALPYYGDHLLGLQNNSNGTILITFSQPIYAVGFRISGRSDTQTTLGTSVTDSSQSLVQQLTVQAFNGATLEGSYTLQDSAGYGDCASIQVHSGYAPCNNAPYIGINGNSPLFGGTSASGPWITSILISSTDTGGFNIDQLQIQDVPFNQSQTEPAPEPGTTVLMGTGLLLGVLLAKKRYTSKIQTN